MIRLAVLPHAYSAWLSALPAARRLTSRSYITSSPPRAPYNILFCGTDKFAAASLSALIANRSSLCSSLHVLTPPDTLQRWGAARMKVSPVKQLALSHELPHDHVPPAGMSDYALPAEFPMSDKSILLTCSFGHMIPDSLLDTFANPWQRINIHPSLLPQLRGAAPIQWALARRLQESGVSIQTLEKGKFDTGTIVAQEAFAFPPVVESAEGIPSFLQVEKVMADRAAELLLRILSDLPGHWANSRPQNESQKTFAPKAKAAFSKIKWHKMTAEDVVARERAFAYLYPLSTTLHPHAASFKPVAVNFFDTSTLLSIQIDSETAELLLADSLPAGSAAFSPALNALVVKTLPEGQGAVLLVVKAIKTEGKKAKSAAEWFKAYRDRADPSTAILTFQ